MTIAKSSRGAERRDLILTSAARLMAERGYSSVSMSQIGAAAGIVGSGVYRHFDSKAIILVALLDSVIKRMLAGSRNIVATTEPGHRLLDAMIRRQTEIVIENRSLVAVYLRDAHNLPVEDFRALRRQQRELIEEWIFACDAIAPYAGETELRTIVQAVLALINSVCTYDNPSPAERLVESIAAMARVALREGLASQQSLAPIVLSGATSRQ